MKKPILIALAGMTFAGCGARQDDSICMPITEPVTPWDASSRVRLQADVDWQRTRAEACVHRQAYRLAHGGDPAETVSKAVMEACEAEVGEAVALIHKRVYDQTTGFPPEQRRESAQTYADEALESYESLSLLKVVEGRAGDCRP